MTTCSAHIQRVTEGFAASIAHFPFVIAARLDDAPVDRSIAFVRSLATIAGELERLVALDSGTVAAVWHGSLERAALFRADLVPFDDVRAPPTRAALAVAGFAERMQRWAHEAPASLVGVMRGFEAALQAADLAEGIAVSVRAHPQRLDCLTVGEPAQIAALDVRIDAQEFDEQAFQAAIAGVRATLAVFSAILEGLEEDPNLFHVLNPDAGRHPVTWDPREMVAAFRSGAASWRRMPYLEIRYGGRGRKFTHSDSLWLTVLSEHADPWSEVEWLARVLTSRGMPSILLEEHLRDLCDALQQAVPARVDKYERLRRAAARLTERRRGALPPREWDALVEQLRAAGPDPYDLARVVAGAVADARGGAPQAVNDLAQWLRTAPDIDRSFVNGAVGVLDRADRPVPDATERRWT